ncbi:hypothetical protein NMY22_g6781 [Coprinellus aureogranulatus]|nr:hypothetical protein NMY22_g6781 [Coprinellus aureogranulatus]
MFFFLSLAALFSLLVMLTYRYRAFILPRVPERVKNLFPSPNSAVYTRLSTFADQVNAGLTSESFDIEANISDGDSRAGLDEQGTREVVDIMKRERVNFDQARLIRQNRILAANGIDPSGAYADGFKSHYKTVMMSTTGFLLHSPSKRSHPGAVHVPAPFQSQPLMILGIGAHHFRISVPRSTSTFHRSYPFCITLNPTYLVLFPFLSTIRFICAHHSLVSPAALTYRRIMDSQEGIQSCLESHIFQQSYSTPIRVSQGPSLRLRLPLGDESNLGVVFDLLLDYQPPSDLLHCFSRF